MSLGECIFVMNRGTLMQIGSPNDVYWRPDSRFVADFMGRTNWFDGALSESGSAGPQFTAASGWSVPLARGARNSGQASLCVRPESVEVRSFSDTAPASSIPGRIVEVIPLGPVRQVVVQLDAGERIIASQTNRAEAAPLPGARVIVSISPEAIVLFPPTA